MLDTDKIIAAFKDRASAFAAAAEKLSKKYNNLSIVRTGVFLCAVVGLIYFANTRNFAAVSTIAIAFPILFAILLKIHNKIAYEKAHALFMTSINNNEILRLETDLKTFDSGERFIDPNHPYLTDLDVFGKNSLFQLLNRCTTESSKRLLANWLNKAAAHEEILQRQGAIQELSPMVDWRQDFQASGMHYEDKESNVHTLLEWLATPTHFLGKTQYKVIIFFLPLISVATILGYFWGIFHYIFPLLSIAMNLVVMRKATPLAADTQEKTYKSIKSLKAYRAMIEKIESQDFDTEKLAALKNCFSHTNFSAAQEIHKLSRILDWLNARNNAFYFLFNIVFLLDIRLLLRAEKWKAQTKAEASKWFDAISEMEVLASLAGFAYAHPEFSFPQLATEPHTYKSKAMGHPLLKRHSRVTNDFEFAGKGNIIVLTGSNMSGKSTFLRTLGTNAVLAFMGSTVCATAMTIGRFQVFTSMRTLDSLEESVSSFYAELKRLKQLLETVGDATPVFFMLDEILKGTNSHDRHKGAAALIRQLSKTNAFGLVSTHDLELGDLAKVSDNITNYSFTSTIINSEIIFDYKLHEGICQSFNATELMKKMGIEIH